MKLPRRQFLHLAAGAAALPAVSRLAWAQTYPSRPITIVVPFPAGGPTDALARVLAEHLSLGLQKPGPITPFVEGTIGAGYFKRYVVSQEQPTAIWEFGADAGALFHFSGPAFVSLSAGWVHPV